VNRAARDRPTAVVVEDVVVFVLPGANFAGDIGALEDSARRLRHQLGDLGSRRAIFRQLDIGSLSFVLIRVC
jgi:hypothetical protein